MRGIILGIIFLFGASLYGGWYNLLFEDFESGIPSNWSVIDGNNDGVTWTAGTTPDLGGYEPPDYGTQYAFYSDDDAGQNAPPGIEELISPAIFVSGYDSLKLSFSWGMRFFGTAYGAVYVRVFTGAWGSWIRIDSIYDYNNGIKNYDLTSFLPSDSLKVKFTFEDPDSSWSWAFGVDNVTLKGFKQITDDVGIVRVISPGSFHYYKNVLIPQVLVKNFGTNTNTFNVYVVIDSQGVVKFTDAVNVTLAGGDSSVVSFSNWTPSSRYDFNFLTYTDLQNDLIPQNDTIKFAFRTYPLLGDYDTFITIPSLPPYSLTGITFCDLDSLFYFVNMKNDTAYGINPFDFTIERKVSLESSGEVSLGIEWDNDSSCFWVLKFDTLNFTNINRKYTYDGIYTGKYMDVTGVGGAFTLGDLDYFGNKVSLQIAYGGDNRIYKIKLDEGLIEGAYTPLWNESKSGVCVVPWSKEIIVTGGASGKLYKITSTGQLVDTSIYENNKKGMFSMDIYGFIPQGDDIWGLGTFNDTLNRIMRIFIGDTRTHIGEDYKKGVKSEFEVLNNIGFEGKLYLSNGFLGKGSHNLKVFDPTGRRVKVISVRPGIIDIAVKKETGVYFIKFKDKVLKFIILK